MRDIICTGIHKVRGGSPRLSKPGTLSRYCVGVCILTALLGMTVQASAELAFDAPVQYAAGARASGLAAGDYDNDGLLDLAVASYSDDKMKILHGQQDGTMVVKSTIYVYRPNQISCADFNGDNIDDLAIARTSGDYFVVGYGTQGVGLGSSQSFATDQHIWYIATGDVNGDNCQDVIAGSRSYDVNSHGRLVTGYGDGYGNFSPVDNYWIGAGVHDVAVGDLNRDGYDDVVILCRWNDIVSVRYSDENGVPQSPAVYYVNDGRYPYRTEMADFNSDGLLDFAVLVEDDDNLNIYFADGQGGFSCVGTRVPRDNTHFLGCDFDKDGLTELVVTDPENESVNMYRVGTNGSLELLYQIDINAVGTELEAADFDGDGWLDLAVGHSSDGDVSIIYNALPEPATMSLLGFGALAMLRRRKGDR